jgi:hypothetical protein
LEVDAAIAPPLVFGARHIGRSKFDVKAEVTVGLSCSSGYAQQSPLIGGTLGKVARGSIGKEDFGVRGRLRPLGGAPALDALKREFFSASALANELALPGGALPVAGEHDASALASPRRHESGPAIKARPGKSAPEQNPAKAPRAQGNDLGRERGARGAVFPLESIIRTGAARFEMGFAAAGHKGRE